MGNRDLWISFSLFYGLQILPLADAFFFYHATFLSLICFLDVENFMAQANDKFVAVFDEVYGNLCRFLECLLGTHSAAQDIAQESFLRLHRFGINRMPVDEARFWLFRVARNLALNELEKGQTRAKFTGKVTEIFHSPVPNPEEIAGQLERKEKLFELLRTLPEHQRAALLLREQEEMSYSEIAEVLKISESKVKSDIFRARNVLREKWNEMNKKHAKAF
jgi:RNA polymerase sigma-70 factor (ECF subfamily)